MDNLDSLLVVIITYNQEQFISQTIDSVLRQKLEIPFKVIIVDDCSTDRTSDICTEYQSKNPKIITYIRRNPNMGLVKNLFYALRDYNNYNNIALCAGDDFWIDENKLQLQYNVLRDNMDISVVFTGVRKQYEKTKLHEDIAVWSSPLLYNQGNLSIKDVLFEKFSSFPVASSMLFRNYGIKEFLKSIESIYKSEGVPGEGMILLSHLASHGKFYFLPNITTVYRINEQSVSHTSSLSKKLNFDIRYYVHKIELSDFFNLKYIYRFKLSLKLYLLYVYAFQDGYSNEFISQLNRLSIKNSSIFVKVPIKVIRYTSNHHFLQYLSLRLLSLKNKYFK